MTMSPPAGLWKPSPKPTTSGNNGEMWRPHLCQNSSTADSNGGGNPHNTTGSRSGDAAERLQPLRVRSGPPAEKHSSWKKVEEAGKTIREQLWAGCKMASRFGQTLLASPLLPSTGSCTGRCQDEVPFYDIHYEQAEDDDQWSIGTSSASSWTDSSDEEDPDDEYEWICRNELNLPTV